ncbi:hypothetical protein F5Y17DRAFT_456182 [Xylariaceae sp. FL0594]|nr:hypothetical protein F5Y17DRAFT_456182 [Xylariaceae sp. FL0594]
MEYVIYLNYGLLTVLVIWSRLVFVQKITATARLRLLPLLSRPSCGMHHTDLHSATEIEPASSYKFESLSIRMYARTRGEPCAAVTTKLTFSNGDALF